MTSKKLLALLGKGVELELHVSMKYMWQHILAEGLEGAIVEKLFREVANTEMKHAEVLVARLAFLNGVLPNNLT